MKRFSKISMLDYVNSELTRLEKRYSFNPNDGYNQVREKEVAIIVEYGKYAGLQQLLFDLTNNQIAS